MTNQMTRQEIFKMLEHEYASANVTEIRVRNLMEMTAHVPVDLLLKAAREYMRNGRFFPRVSDFLEAVKVATNVAEFERRQNVDVNRYGRFRTGHSPVSDEARMAYEQSAGMMRPTAVINAEIEAARRELQNNPRFIELVNYRKQMAVQGEMVPA